MKGYLIYRGRYNERFYEKLWAAEGRVTWSGEEIESYRDTKIRNFLAYASKEIPYYHQLFQKLKLNPQDIRTLEDLRSLPILSKEVVQDRYFDLQSKNIKNTELTTVRTSGSTGGGLIVITTAEALHEQWATWWRYRRWHKIPFNTWHGFFGGRAIVPVNQSSPPFWRINYPEKQIRFSPYHMTSKNLDSYVEALREKKPLWLHGYPSYLSLIANHINDRGYELGYEVQWVTTGSENLLPQQAQAIKKAFGVQPRQHYGMAEAVANISECELGQLHVDEDYAAVEFVPNSYGSGYKVIGSNFNNIAMPLLRYDVHDIVSLPDKDFVCPCGKPGRVVTRIDGRQEDYVVLKNGAYLGHVAHIFSGMENVREAQLYQRIPGKVVARIVRGTNYTARDESLIRQRFEEKLGNMIEVTFDYLDVLERTASGKLRFVLSELPEAQISQNNRNA